MITKKELENIIKGIPKLELRKTIKAKSINGSYGYWVYLSGGNICALFNKGVYIDLRVPNKEYLREYIKYVFDLDFDAEILSVELEISKINI